MQGAKAIAEMLKKNSSLRVLELNNNMIEYSVWNLNLFSEHRSECPNIIFNLFHGNGGRDFQVWLELFLRITVYEICISSE